MAKLPSKRKLLREDVKEAPAWIDKILGFVNPFFEDVYFSLNKNITLRENIDCDIKEIVIETSTTYQNNIPNLIPVQAEIDAIDIRITDLETAIASITGLPIGAVTIWTSLISLPIGYLECTGTAISRTTYNQLFAIIGTRYGVGDGSTTFNLPNYQGLVPRGINTQSVNNRVKDGGLLGEVLEDQMQRIIGSAVPKGDSGAAGSNMSQNSIASGAFELGGTESRRDFAVTGTNRTTRIGFDFNSATSPDARTSTTTGGETRVSSLGSLFIIRAQNLEIASATSSAIDALNARVTITETDILAIEAQIPPPITAITGLADFMKVGTFSNNTDANQTITFPVAFSSGSDSDISVILNFQVSNSGLPLMAINITKTQFQVDRTDSINWTANCNWIAVNGFYL